MSDHKESVRVATTANINLASMPATLDGVTLAVNDRILVKDQTAGAENGLYRFDGAAVPAERTPDALHGADLNSGALVPVEAGTAGGNKVFMLTTDNPVKVGTTALVWAQV